MNEGFRPITEAERPHVEALGRLLRALRDEAGLTQRQVAVLASLQPATISAIERGRRRTRASTLVRIAAALVPEHRLEVAAAELIETAGPGLGSESSWSERLERRRRRRERRDRPAAIAALKEALASSRRLARLWPEGHPRHEFGVEMVAGLEAQLARMESEAAEDRTQRSGPPSDAGRPAWSKYQAFVFELTGGRMRGTLHLTAAQQERLYELTAARDAEAADLSSRLA